MQQTLLEAPVSDSSHTYEKLGYVDAYDAVLNCDYAFVAYKETDRDGGQWRVRIRSCSSQHARRRRGTAWTSWRGPARCGARPWK